MYASSDWVGFRCVGSSAATYGKKVCRQDHEPVDLSSTSDTEGQSDQQVRSHQAQWNVQFKKLDEFKERHGHCELFSFLVRIIFIFNTPLTPVCLPELQAMFHRYTRKTHNLAIGSTVSVNASKMAA
jgi:hypothetical protein